MTVGLVIVSHSAQLARGVVELVDQMTQGKVPLVAAGGAGEGILGTSADTIAQAIEQIDSSDGVLILLDLGSALLSAEMALEFLSDEQRAHVALTFAPLVEGAVAAAMEAALGRSLAQVKQAAEQTAQRIHLLRLKPIPDESPTETSPPSQVSTSSTPAPLPVDSLEVTLQITNPSGLHARPASLLVQTAAAFQSTITIQRPAGPPVDATSILAVLSLGVRQGETIVVRASGPDAAAALATLKALAEANFHEQPAPTPSAAVTAPAPSIAPASDKAAPASPEQPADSWQGISTSPGYALGPAFVITDTAPVLAGIEQQIINDEQVSLEQQRLHDAVQKAGQELHELAQRLKTHMGNEADIFNAQALMLDDPELKHEAEQLIEQHHLDAASALARAGEQMANTIAQLPDPLLAARAADIRDAVGRAVRFLRPESVQSPLQRLRQPSVLIAHDLTPSDTAQLRPELVLGIATVQGGPTAHAAILARALGIPALAGLPEIALRQLRPGQEVGLDASKGRLYAALSSELRTLLQQRVQEQQQRQTSLKAGAARSYTPVTLGRRKIQLLANVGSVAEAEAARQWGAGGIGLLRTEFLLANTAVFPDEQQQRRLYIQVFQAFLGQSPTRRGPVVVRTLDAGADKPMPALEALIGSTEEANPALGVRGIRVHLAHTELLEQQIRALLLASVDTGIELHIMFPMVSTVEEVHTLKAIMARVQSELRQKAIALPPRIPSGIMVEVPSAALMAPELAQLVDFFSIGANDLLQYTLASDRTNAALSTLYTPTQPALLRFIHMIAQAARQAGKPVAVCGEMAGDARLAPLLVGLGVDELSMAPSALAAVRATLSKRSIKELTALANRALKLTTVAEVEALCREALFS